MTIDRRTVGLVLSETAGLGTLGLLLFYLSVSGATQISGVWSVDRVIAYVLLFTAPLLIFFPPASLLRLGPVWLLGAGSWALLGYLLVFSAPPAREEAGFFTYVAFLALLFVALLSALSLPMGALGKRLPPPASPTTEMVRALRQGGLLALFLVALLVMSPLGVLNWLNTLLVFTIVALTEFFFLARD